MRGSSVRIRFSALFIYSYLKWILTNLLISKRAVIDFSMFQKFFCISFFAIYLLGCEEEKTVNVGNVNGESALTRMERIKELEADIQIAEWENARLSLKLRKVNGGSLVRDKKTNLWHYDVERTPFTGIAVEQYADGSPQAEAHFLEGQKDGMERFWYPNGQLKEEGQWFNNRANGLMRSWDEKGKLSKAVRYKNGDLIEVLRQ
ncbi:MAG: hypothetical protein EBY48_04225 [Opitutae bacterium]|nr:hypothetical protein [Opitutae bacterium]